MQTVMDVIGIDEKFCRPIIHMDTIYKKPQFQILEQNFFDSCNDIVYVNC